ncbi:hypothetical protein QR78_11650 [Methylobacterium indicum]|uniref:Uncharacterized protein n=2 Tax=Methylobacterium indicum TaxID=1775910 RepID=A0ABR5H8A9_9HYPH|nr:hypothetical protein QR78_11650 [Methylobacterium indicum]KMO20917.1 hypothetical protein QR79_17480 [Methylobacterium indicum]
MKEAIARALPAMLAPLREQLYALNGSGLIDDSEAGELDDAIDERVSRHCFLDGEASMSSKNVLDRWRSTSDQVVKR